MTNEQMYSLAQEHTISTGKGYYTAYENPSDVLGFTAEGLATNKAWREGWSKATDLIIQHLQSLPLESMTGKEVEQSLFNEFLHIQ